MFDKLAPVMKLTEAVDQEIVEDLHVQNPCVTMLVSCVLRQKLVLACLSYDTACCNATILSIHKAST